MKYYENKKTPVSRKAAILTEKEIRVISVAKGTRVIRVLKKGGRYKGRTKDELGTGNRELGTGNYQPGLQISFVNSL